MLTAWPVELLMQTLFWLLPKEKEETIDGEDVFLVPFRYNRIQKHLEKNLAARNLLLKARQIGGTTYFSLRRLLLPAITEPGIGCILVSQSNDYVEKHFQIIRRAYQHIAEVDPARHQLNDLSKSLKEHLLHTTASNRRELIFSQLDSRVMVESAEVEEGAQGVTLHHILADEYSRWPHNPENTLSNIQGALVKSGTLDKNCTANGAIGPFYEDCLRAINDPANADARLHYYSWWWADEYYLDLSPEKAKELEADLDATEKNIVKKIRLELEDVTWHRSMEKMAWRRNAKLEQRGNFDEKYPEDPITAFLVAGKQYFDRDVLIARKHELVDFKPFQEWNNGEAILFNQRVPGRRYIIGADIATGRTVNNEDTDFCCAVCLDIETGEEMASLHARVTPEDFALDLADLARYFNNALVAIERTGDGATCILTLKGECKYGAIYRHKEWIRREKKAMEFDGFPTNTKTRPIALNKVNRFVLDHPELIWDARFIDEALVFVRNEKGIPAAAPGAHDDRVSARWVAHYVRLVTLGYLDPVGSTSEKYENADRMTDEAA